MLKWILAIVVVLGLVVGGGVFGMNRFVKSQPAYAVAERFVLTNDDLARYTGPGATIGLLPTGTISKARHEARYRLTVNGPAASTRVSVTLRDAGKVWVITSATYETPDEPEVILPLEGGTGPIREARALRSQRDYEGALAVLDKAIEDMPNEPEPWYWRGMIRMDRGEPFMALPDFERAVSLGPDHRPAREALVKLLVKESDWDRVASIWSDWILGHPQDGAAVFGRAEAYKMLGEPESADADYRAACALGHDAACNAIGGLPSDEPPPDAPGTEGAEGEEEVEEPNEGQVRTDQEVPPE